MPEIIWKYYLAKGPEADDVLSRAKQAWDGIKAHRESLMEEYKANGVLPGDRKKYTITGLLYYEKPDYDFMVFTESSQKTADGRSFFIARPKLNNMNGQELARKLAAPEVTFDRKNELISLLGLACMADFTASANQTSTSLVWSSATAVDGGHRREDARRRLEAAHPRHPAQDSPLPEAHRQGNLRQHGFPRRKLVFPLPVPAMSVRALTSV